MSYFKIGPEARAYVEDRLAYGHALSQLVSRRLPAAELQAKVALPDDRTDADLSQLGFGGKLPILVSVRGPDGSRITRVENTFPDLAREIVVLGMKRAGTFVILENRLAAPTDPWLERLKVPPVAAGVEVYHLLTAATMSFELVEEALAASSHPSGFAGLLGHVSESRSAELARQTSLTTADLEELVQASHTLIVDVYDGESYMLVELPPSPAANELV